MPKSEKLSIAKPPTRRGDWIYFKAKGIFHFPLRFYVVLVRASLEIRWNAQHNSTRERNETKYNATVQRPRKNKTYREHTVLWKRHQGAHCVVIPWSKQILYYLKFSMWWKPLQNGMIASEHCLINFQCKTWWTPWRFWWASIVICFNAMIHHIITPQIGLAQQNKIINK